MSVLIHNDTNPYSKYRKLLDNIPLGEDKAISMSGLSSILCITERETRKLVEKCRMSGNIICATEAGYFIPETMEELCRFHNRMNARISTCRKSLVPVKNVLIEEGRIIEYYDSLFS